jgi:hypothetical protein
MSWQALEAGNQELAEFGLKRFASNYTIGGRVME